MTDPTSLLWHYTTGHNGRGILRTGLIRPATAGVPKRERPAVWFTARETFEPTATKYCELPDGRVRSLTIEETAARCGGLVRFGVSPETAPYDWPTFVRMSGTPKPHAKNLERAARRMGSDHRIFYVSFDPVPLDACVAVEVGDLTGDIWTPFPADDLARIRSLYHASASL